MPFTLSHPAAVLPLRSRLPLAALAAGSVSPDLGYYFGVAEYVRENAHTAMRSFTFCLPAGFLLLLVVFLLRDGIAVLLPAALRLLLGDLFLSPLISLRALPRTLLAILLGAWTHLFWDSWTHRSGYFVQTIPALQVSLFEGLELYRLLQHLSTLGGAAALLYFAFSECYRLQLSLRFEYSWRAGFWLSLFSLALVFTYFTLTSPWNYLLANHDHRLWFLFIISVMRNFFVALLLVAAGVQLHSRVKGTGLHA